MSKTDKPTVAPTGTPRCPKCGLDLTGVTLDAIKPRCARCMHLLVSETARPHDPAIGGIFDSDEPRIPQREVAPTGTSRCSCPSRSEPIQHDILCPLHAPTGTPTDRKTLAEVYAHEYAYNLHPDEPSLAALFLKFANDCTSRFTAAPTGTGEGSDWIHEVDPVLCGLKYIAESPSQEYGGFHPEAVKTAKNALAEIITLRSQLEEARRPFMCKRHQSLLSTLLPADYCASCELQSAQAEIATLGRLCSEAHGALADIGARSGAPPSRWMLEYEKFCFDNPAALAEPPSGSQKD